MFYSERELQAGYDPVCVAVWRVSLSRCFLHSCHVVLRACLPSCSKLPIDSVCHGLAQHPQRVAFVCSQPCPESICCWDGLQCCHHPNQNKWTFVCCILLNISKYVPQKCGENSCEAQLLFYFLHEVKKGATIRNMGLWWRKKIQTVSNLFSGNFMFALRFRELALQPATLHFMWENSCFKIPSFYDCICIAVWPQRFRNKAISSWCHTMKIKTNHLSFSCI